MHTFPFSYSILVLSAALESSAESDPLAAARVLRRLKHEHKCSELEQAAKIAAYRSGARGMKARKELKALEEELVAVTAACVPSLSRTSFMSLACSCDVYQGLI